MSKVDMSARAVSQRLREVSRLFRERERREIDMSPSAVSARIREVEKLRKLCLSLGKLKTQ